MANNTSHRVRITATAHRLPALRSGPAPLSLGLVLFIGTLGGCEVEHADEGRSTLAARTVDGPIKTDTMKPRPASTELRTVPTVDLPRFMGLWYEIARYPNIFQKNLVAVAAEYELADDGTIHVKNTGRRRTLDREESVVTGVGRVVDPSSKAKWGVNFLPLITAPYWIIDLDEAYEYAVVGQPSRRYLWILSRKPTLDETVLEGILTRLREQGYDPEKARRTPQPPGGARVEASE